MKGGLRNSSEDPERVRLSDLFNADLSPERYWRVSEVSSFRSIFLISVMARSPSVE